MKARWKSAVDAVAKLHSIDPKEIGLSDYGVRVLLPYPALADEM